MKYTLFFALLSAGALWADCPVAERPTNEAEQKYYVDTFNALRALVPAAPTGWQIQDRQAKMVAAAPKSLCADAGSLIVNGYFVTYLNVAGMKELSAKQNEFNQKINVLRRPSPEEQAKLNDVEGR